MLLTEKETEKETRENSNTIYNFTCRPVYKVLKEVLYELLLKYSIGFLDFCCRSCTSIGKYNETICEGYYNILDFAIHTT